MFMKKLWLMKWFIFYCLCFFVWIWFIIFNINQLQKKEQNQKTASHNFSYITEKYDHKNVPGDYGKPFYLDEKILTPVEKVKYDEGWKNYEFNQYVSDLISVHRNLPDIRDPLCKSVEWFKPLPQTSVIIIFYNEAFSVLLRTIHSVLDRSDNNLIKEVILVDDSSDLCKYIQQLNKREGLIRARLNGARIATGEVLIFLDSHCEVTEGWLEPLLDPIARNPNVSTVPIIETIDYINFGLTGSSLDQIQIGGFNWNLIYDWHPIPKHELLRRSKKTDPIRSPTMAGGLFAINRKYFQTLGSYDPGFDIWGAENLELSFKIWMCGGELVSVPCSHVGHIFRVKFPYKFPSKVDVAQRNTIRLAEVWLDDYKNFYYERIGQDYIRDYGNISERKALRQSLKCKSFDWYIKSIFPEQIIPSETIQSGQISHDGYCLESPGFYLNLNPIKCGTYSSQISNQFWYLTNYNEIRFDSQCIIYKNDTKKILTTDCMDNKGKFKWIYKNNQIKLFNSNDCIEISPKYDKIFLKRCNLSNKFQRWQWPKRINIK